MKLRHQRSTNYRSLVADSLDQAGEEVDVLGELPVAEELLA
ncbi:MAG: hypothetical protein ABJA87_11610 [bacterium]